MFIAKSFPRKQVRKKIYFEKKFLSKIFIVAKSFPRKQICRKKYFEKIFLVDNFYCCKIISSKTGLQGEIF